jgi:hypothetical protein
MRKMFGLLEVLLIFEIFGEMDSDISQELEEMLLQDTMDTDVITTVADIPQYSRADLLHESAGEFSAIKFASKKLDFDGNVSNVRAR